MDVATALSRGLQVGGELLSIDLAGNDLTHKSGQYVADIIRVQAVLDLTISYHCRHMQPADIAMLGSKACGIVMLMSRACLVCRFCTVHGVTGLRQAYVGSTCPITHPLETMALSAWSRL